MRALVTASFDEACLERLRRHMDVVHEDWKATGTIHFDATSFATHVREVGADVLVVEADFVQAEVMDAGPLRVIGSCRGDPVNVDLAAATARGIPVFHAPGRNADAVADLTLAFMLGLTRRLYEADRLYRVGGGQAIRQASDFLAIYTRLTGVELGGLVVGLVGLGAVGREVAARLHAFKTTILAYDPYVTAPPEGVRLTDLDTLLAASDVVSLHAPVTPETTGLLSRERLARMKPSAILINTARAALTDEDALYEMLCAGRLGGAALDVLAKEPLQPDDRFLSLPNVVCTPHIGGATVDVVRHHSETIVDAIERHLAGERPRFVANPDVLGRDS